MPWPLPDDGPPVCPKVASFQRSAKHGSWLNRAEIELSVLERQGLGERIESREDMAQVTGAWEEDRNERNIEAKWRFTTADARIKLHKLYPSLQ